MASPPFDVAVVGGGIMGLGCAFEEARRGKRVAVYDPAAESQKASWAAAGILVTRGARLPLSPFREFYVRSIEMYPAWLDAINAASGHAVKLRQGGDYLLFELGSREGREKWDAKCRQLEREHAAGFTVSDKVPAFLAERCRLEKPKALHFPDESSINNRDLLAALREACLRLGARFFNGADAPPWQAARQAVIAAGAWTGRVLEGLGLSAPMIPVKGQMLRIPNFHGRDHMIHFQDDLYLIPRGEDLVVGATTEAGVWDEGFDASGEESLLGRLHRFLPEVSGQARETWAGLRPRTRDRLPWMGWLDASKGWALCAGHYKTGISMAPLAAQSISKLLNGEKPAVDLGPFDPWRKQGLA